MDLTYHVKFRFGIDGMDNWTLFDLCGLLDILQITWILYDYSWMDREIFKLLDWLMVIFLYQEIVNLQIYFTKINVYY